MLTLEASANLENRLYVDRLGHAYCHECAPAESNHGGGAYTGSTEEFIDTCRTCYANIALKPETITGNAMIEHVACKIF